MINRDDMLELTRRMTPKRTCISYIAGAYLDREGKLEGSFHTHMSRLSESEKKKNLEIAKAIPFAESNVKLKEYAFPLGKTGRRQSMSPLLAALLEKGLEDDELLQVFYEVVAEKYEARSEYAIYVFYGTYDIPRKGSDKEWLEGSEEIYSFIICAIAPLIGEYEPGKPNFGFLYPAFSERSGDSNRVDIFQADPKREQSGLLHRILYNEDRPIVKLSAIIDAIEMADDAWTQFFDTEKLEVLSLPEYSLGCDLDEEYDALAEEIDNDVSGRFLCLPTRHDIHEYSIMEDFIYELKSPEARAALEHAIQGRGAFRRFKDTLYRYGIEEKWYSYQAEAYRKLAIRWCEENRLDYEE